MWFSAVLGLLWITLANAALYNNVVPVDSEFYSICGMYAFHTPTFSCNAFVNGTGYSSCIANPFSCSCLPEAPYRFQQDLSVPCKYNYGIEQCTAGEATQFCGSKALGCTKRCDYLGQCYEADVCICQAGYEMPSNRQYCSYAYQADQCLTAPVSPDIQDRDITSCGIFATQAFYVCPNSTNNYDPALCLPKCNCQPGTGRTPTSETDCDGIDVPCNPGDIMAACGNGYSACTKRCQYTNTAPTVHGKCVVLSGSCVVQNTTLPSGTYPCEANQVLSLCGPETQSCVQYRSAGVVVNTTCTCTSNGVPSFSGTIKCDAWVSYIEAPYSQCVGTCTVPGFINGTHHPCQYRRFITISPNLIPYTGTNQQKQMYWLVSNNAVTFNRVAMSQVDQMDTVRTLAAANNLNTYAYALQCDCDSSGVLAAIQALGVLQQGIPQIDMASELLSIGPGWNRRLDLTSYPPDDGDPTYFGYPYILYGLNPGPTYKLYPLDMNSQLDAFYQLNTCYGPWIAVTAGVGLNVADGTAQASQPPALVTQIVQAGSNLYTLSSSDPSNPTPMTCTPLSPPPFEIDNNWVLAEVLFPYPQRPWILTYVVESIVYSVRYVTFECDNVAGYDAQWRFNRRGGQYIEMVPSGQLVAYAYQYSQNLYGSQEYSQVVCSGKGTITPYSINSTTMAQDLAIAMGVQNMQAYTAQTFGANFTKYSVVPVSGQATAQPGITASAYGPIGLNSYRQMTCSCFGGFGGPVCSKNIACMPCVFNPSTCPENTNNAACLNTANNIQKWVPTISASSPGSWLIFQFDQAFNSPPILNPSNCPISNPNVPYVDCDLNKYKQVFNQYCVNGVPTYNNVDGSITCACHTGWSKVDNGNPYAPCTVAAAGNCPSTSVYCNSFGYGPRPSQNCTCGGHGLIDTATGSCICEINWRKDSNGCCSLSNECDQTCVGNSNNHITVCNKTATNGASWVCSDQTNGGVWTGTCCNTFVPNSGEECVHGATYAGESVFKVVNDQLVPLTFASNLTTPAGFNPNSAFCNCLGGGTWTGLLCDQSPCPVGSNGVVCSGHGVCLDGQCMQVGSGGELQCADNDYYGCACQFNLVTSCRGTEGTPLCNLRGECGATNAQNLSLSCSCQQGYFGQYCQNSMCGPTDCNAADDAGVCVHNTTSNTYACQCKDFNPLICFPGQTGCLYGGPTCDYDVTEGCASIINNRASLCNFHGYCNVTGFEQGVSPECVCTDGWISPNNKCETQPCSPECGPNGDCKIVDGSPVCQCHPFWSPSGGAAPCSTNGCTYGYPSGPGLGAKCVCNDTLYSYETNCTQRDCNSYNDVKCGQVNCALMSNCRDTTTQTCRPFCTDFPQTCNNGTCECHWSSEYDFFEGYCISRCAEWPKTTNILGKFNEHGAFVFDRCVCDPNYSEADHCFSPVCLNGGSLVNGICSCLPGWSGPRCLDKLCNDHGVFNNGTSNNCTCFFPWTGPQCQQNVCLNGGVAVDDPLTSPDGVCECPVAYIGTRCEFDQCEPHGRASLDGTTCECEPGWSGVHCQVFGCYYPNEVFNNTCKCADNYYGPACQYLKCGPAGDFVNGTCVCGGVSLPRNESGFINCTGNSCGAYGLPSRNLAVCFCNSLSVFRPVLDSNHSFNCVPDCQNGGVYNNTIPIGCDCPPGTTPPICELIPISSTGVSSSSSSTGGGGGSSTGSGGHHSSSTATSAATSIRPYSFLDLSLALCLCLLGFVFTSYLL